MRFYVYFSDNDYVTISGDDAKDAYKKAAPQAVGRYITTIDCSALGERYYSVKDGGFKDPLEAKKKVIKNLTDNDIGKHVASNRKSFVDNGCTYYFSRRNGLISYVDANERPLGSFKFSVSVEREEPAAKGKHAWENATCASCGADLFDVADPNGECEG